MQQELLAVRSENRLASWVGCAGAVGGSLGVYRQVPTQEVHDCPAPHKGRPLPCIPHERRLRWGLVERGATSWA
jgi:hypothetical protein